MPLAGLKPTLALLEQLRQATLIKLINDHKDFRVGDLG
jgi:hypothetical protein